MERCRGTGQIGPDMSVIERRSLMNMQVKHRNSTEAEPGGRAARWQLAAACIRFAAVVIEVADGIFNGHGPWLF